MSESEYKPTKEDILSMLHYLRVRLPDYATPENALKLLNQYQGYYEALEELHPEEIEKVLRELETQ